MMLYIPTTLLLLQGVIVLVSSDCRMMSGGMKKKDKALACPEDWILFQGHCYYTFTGDPIKTFYEAKTMCNEENSYLARVESEKENRWIYQQVAALNDNSVEYFLGGTDLVTEGQFFWESNAKKIAFSDWNIGAITSDTGDCLSLRYITSRSSWKWVDDNCMSLKRFVCEADAYCFMLPSEIQNITLIQ